MLKKLPNDDCNLNFDTTVKSWDEGIPLGNGLMGCLIWGEGDRLRFSLDRGDLWDNTVYPGILADNFTYSTLAQLAKDGNTAESRKIFDAPYYYPTPTKLPAGKLMLAFQNAVNVKSALSLAKAEAEITVEQQGKATRVSSFLHATQRAGFIKVAAPRADFSCSLQNPKFGKKGDTFAYAYDAQAREISSGGLEQLKYEAAETGTKQLPDGISVEWFTQKVDEDLAYGIALAFAERDGCTEIVYAVLSNHDAENWLEDGIARIAQLLGQGYDANLPEHQNWWGNYWGQSSLSLPNKAFEKQWYLTNYLFGSCSRKGAPPMPLQGVWTADNDALPPWKGDYHQDLNLQMCYYHYLKANHISEGESLLDFLTELAPTGRKFAEDFYGTKGLCLPAVMSIIGQALGGWPMYALSPANQLWTCQAFERHYRFTGDLEFLREMAYPNLSESAQCILGLMTEGENGKLHLPVSSSSELHDDEPEAWVTPNSNYDLSLIRYAVTQLIDFAKVLQNGEEAHWTQVLQKLPQLAVNEVKVLMISPDESLHESHRHHAHAMAIHPLRLLDIDKAHDKEIIDATILDMEVLGSGMWVGFSFAWMAELYAIQKNGNGAAFQLELFWRNFCSQNGFHLNGDYKRRGSSQFHYRPFTLEATMCAADALQEMLLKTENNLIELFPAIPDEWQRGEVAFENFRGELGLLISAKMYDGRLQGVQLKAQKQSVYTLRTPHGEQLRPADGTMCEFHSEGEKQHLHLQAGQNYHFIIVE